MKKNRLNTPIYDDFSENIQETIYKSFRDSMHSVPLNYKHWAMHSPSRMFGSPTLDQLQRELIFMMDELIIKFK